MATTGGVLAVVETGTTGEPAIPEDFQLARALDLLRGLAFFNARAIN